MLGRVLKRLGHADRALLSLNIAMDLANPKDRSVVKSGMRTLPSMLHVVWDKAVFFTTMMSACVGAAIDKLHSDANDESADESLGY